jgi:hypothetical protein
MFSSVVFLFASLSFLSYSSAEPIPVRRLTRLDRRIPQVAATTTANSDVIVPLLPSDAATPTPVQAFPENPAVTSTQTSGGGTSSTPSPTDSDVIVPILVNDDGSSNATSTIDPKVLAAAPEDDGAQCPINVTISPDDDQGDEPRSGSKSTSRLDLGS